MWLWLLHLALAVNFSPPCALAQSAPEGGSSSVGPVSRTEAKILWKDSQALYEQGEYRDAAVKLRRLLDRYPGYPDAARYRELRFQLGKSYLELGQHSKAIPQLRAYLEGAGSRKHPETARLLLGDAYLELKRYNEAYLAAAELEKHSSPEIRSRALLLRGHAMIGLDQDSQAQRFAGSALKEAEQLRSAELTGAANALRLELKTRECARLPGKGRMTEAQVRSRLDQRGICLNEAMILFRRALGSEDARSSDEALQLIRDAYQSYRSSCENPPDPPRLKPKDRTAEQLKRYRIELADSLRQFCREKEKAALSMIATWKGEDPSASVRERLEKLEDALQ